MELFLKNLVLGREGDLSRAEKKQYLSDAVTLSTLHGSKGLEFPVVFLCGLKKGTIPLERPGKNTNPAEERRLFYVGMTRAKDELLLTGSPENSPFQAELTGLQEEHPHAFSHPEEKQLSFFDL